MIQIKLIGISHEHSKHFTEISIFPIEILPARHYTRQGLGDSTASAVYTVGKALLPMFAAAFRLKWINQYHSIASITHPISFDGNLSPLREGPP
jgi:hypothetical protein